MEVDRLHPPSSHERHHHSTPPPATTTQGLGRPCPDRGGCVDHLLILGFGPNALASCTVRGADRVAAMGEIPQAGPRAFFRLQFPIASTLPQSATLWVEGFQQVTTFVDGTKVALAATVPNVLVDTAPDVPKTVQTIDIRSNLAPGINAVGLEVASLDGQAPAFRARLEVRTGTQVQYFGISPSSWESTTDAGLTGQVLPASGVFSRSRFEDGDWVHGVPSSPRPGTATSVLPPDAFTQPADAPALTGSFGARSLIASTVVNFPAGCSEGWMRVAATGTYTVSLDGRNIASGNAGTSPTSLPLSIFDLCPVASAGRHVLTISVGASQRPVAYVDGYLRSGSHAVWFATGPKWHAGTTGARQATATLIGTTNSPESDIGLLFQRVPASITVPSGPLFIDHLLLLCELLLVALIGIMVATAFGVTLTGAVTCVLCGTLPAVGLVLLLTETRHIVFVQPPFPSTPNMLALVLGVGALGLIVAVAGTIRIRQRSSKPGPDRSTAPSAKHVIDGRGGYGRRGTKSPSPSSRRCGRSCRAFTSCSTPCGRTNCPAWPRPRAFGPTSSQSGRRDSCTGNRKSSRR